MIRKALSTATLFLTIPCLATTTPPAKKHHTAPTTAHHSSSHAVVAHKVSVSHSHRTTHKVEAHYQPANMDVARATQIQQALIHSGYLSGTPTGVWDSQSVAAMQKMQGDNGWQTKITPDSRALIKLGLGPQDEKTSSTEVATGNGGL